MTRLTPFAVALTCLTASVAPTYAQVPAARVAIGVGPAFGPRVGPWFGPYYGPGFGAWGYGYGWGGWGFGGWGPAGTWASVPLVPGGLWGTGINYSGLPTFALASTPGSFSANGGYGFGAGLYGAGKDLPTVLPRGNGPVFATRDVRRHFDAVKANPNIALDRAYRDRMGWYR